MPKKDWTGIKINKLTFLYPSEIKRPGTRSIMWQAECECGQTRIVQPAQVARGDVKDCGSYTNHPGRTRVYEPMISSAREVWKNRYSDGDITFEDFFRLSQSPCDYCGIDPQSEYNRADWKSSEYQEIHGKFTYNGLDRVNNSIKIHTLENVVPCCRDCNFAKGNKTREEFIAQIARQYNHLTKVGYVQPSLEGPILSATG